MPGRVTGAPMAHVRPMGDVALPTGESLVVLQDRASSAPRLAGVDVRALDQRLQLAPPLANPYCATSSLILSAEDATRQIVHSPPLLAWLAPALWSVAMCAAAGAPGASHARLLGWLAWPQGPREIPRRLPLALLRSPTGGLFAVERDWLSTPSALGSGPTRWLGATWRAVRDPYAPRQNARPDEAAELVIDLPPLADLRPMLLPCRHYA
jgi:hypothetical protein